MQKGQKVRTQSVESQPKHINFKKQAPGLMKRMSLKKILILTSYFSHFYHSIIYQVRLNKDINIGKNTQNIIQKYK